MEIWICLCWNLYACTHNSIEMKFVKTKTELFICLWFLRQLYNNNQICFRCLLYSKLPYWYLSSVGLLSWIWMTNRYLSIVRIWGMECSKNQVTLMWHNEHRLSMQFGECSLRCATKNWSAPLSHSSSFSLSLFSFSFLFSLYTTHCVW